MAYTIVDKIAKVRLLCRKVLPAVYDESLSYLEGLSKLTHKLNETIESVNALNDNVDALNDSVTDLNSRVEAVEGVVGTFIQQMQEAFDELAREQDAKVDAKLAEVDVKLEDVDARVTALEQSIDAKFAEFEAKINKSIEELTKIVTEQIEIIQHLYQTFEADMKAYVDEELQKALDQIPDLTNIYVIDPTTGKLEKVQKALHNVMIFNAYNALTIDEFNALGMTVNGLNSIIVKSIPKGMTIREWLHDAKRILLEQIDNVKAKILAYPHSFVREYLSGTLVWHDRNVDVNQQLIASSGCYSCDEINTLAFTVDEINAFEITCFNYVMKANSIMVRTV